MKYFLCIVKVLLLTRSTVYGRLPTECNYANGLCSIDIDGCLKSPLSTGDLHRRCELWEYSDLYREVTNTSFSMLSENNWNYALVAIDKNLTWRLVDGCCSLMSGETCQMSPIGDDEELKIFGTRGTDVCYEYILVHSTAQTGWCMEKKTEPPCLFLDKGNVKLRKKFDDANLQEVRSRMEFCIFEIPEEIVIGNSNQEDGRKLFWNVPKISIDQSESGSDAKFEEWLPPQVKTEAGTVPCDVTKNISEPRNVWERNVPSQRALCFFLRILPDGHWYPSPHCMKYLPILVKADISIPLVTLFCILSMGCMLLLILRKYVKKCFPSYVETNEDISKRMANVCESQEFLTSVGKTASDLKESPEEITISGVEGFRNRTKSEDAGFIEYSNGNEMEAVRGPDNLTKSKLASSIGDHLDSGCVLEVTSDSFAFASNQGRSLASERKMSSGAEVGPNPSKDYVRSQPGSLSDYTNKDEIIADHEQSNCKKVHVVFPGQAGECYSFMDEDSSSNKDAGFAPSDAELSAELKPEFHVELDITDYVKKF